MIVIVTPRRARMKESEREGEESDDPDDPFSAMTSGGSGLIA